MNDNKSKSVAESIFSTRSEFRDIYPLKEMSVNLIQKLISLFFPHHTTIRFTQIAEVDVFLDEISANLIQILISLGEESREKRNAITKNFIDFLPNIYQTLLLDAEFIFQGDPAAKHLDDVILTYPGFGAITMYRLAHSLCMLGVPTVPRVITEYAHQQTGIDIHPGAKIGKPFFIDHGTGTVIGETCEIGNFVKLYQGVTLGALSVEKKLSTTKRHPTIQDRVIIYSGATILGGETVIGHDSVIGGNVWLTSSINPFMVVYHKSDIQIRNIKEKENVIDFSI
ncbi:MAG: serine acetyltransferase [Chloroherpetonaceae bacterium]|nr:serine acetyltransferase [Chloroherpetonaceae bacterium]